MSWLARNWPHILDLVRQHLELAGVPLLAGLLLSVPLGWLANRSVAARGLLLSVSGVLYTIPSLALLVVLPAVIGTKILNPVNVMVALTVYTIALLVRSVTDALGSVPTHVVSAADAMGFRPLRRFLTVELPLAVPVVVAGLRVAAVSNISLVSVGALIGVGGLGELFTDGFQLQFLTPIVVGIVGSVLLALLADAVLLVAGRALTPWERGARRAG
ncbi:ABC transporter permease [Gandjariella thermophila]|uniref:Glycine/betaine ABC transporter permease n=1 Tax=Gandjariella thermophila TaxID=1931992 RepID=A0A4D4JBM2_9PSEU|nr:ABC transporter permease [Gandjariella thermophila]GDY31253.1 glycine/betaine ABC transporter permease [Gandjariella thermophila]